MKNIYIKKSHSQVYKSKKKKKKTGKLCLIAKKLANFDSVMYNLNSNKLYFSENLSCVNENVAFKARKIKSKVFIHACFMKDGVAHSKLGEHGKCIKILHKSHFNSYILDFEEEEFDFFHDVSQEMNNSVLIWKITFL